jgi:hypothetical protein
MRLDTRLIRRIHHRLKRRHKKAGGKGLLAVGLGWPEKSTTSEGIHPRTIVYLVKRAAHKRKIPSHAVGYMIHGKGEKKRRKYYRFPIEVIEVGPKTVLTCFRADSPTGDFFTLGALVKWGSASGPNYGALTVGHGVPPNVPSSVKLTLDSGATVTGSVVAATSKPFWLDAALIKFGPDVPLSALLPPAGTPSPPIPSSDDLDDAADQNLGAASCNWTDLLPIGLRAYFPTQAIIDDGAYLTEILLAQGADGTFAPGTSGSVWMISPAALAIQVAGTETSRLPNGTIHNWIYGFAQPMCEYVNWAKNLDIVNSQPFQLLGIL